MEKIRGVNLGGWLVVEKWITPSLFRGTLARDETGLSKELGSRAAEILREHHENFIREGDIIWLKEHGITSLRVPLPYWILGGTEPYVGSIKRLDWLMDIALKHELSVLLDLHAAPGSQNGHDHSGLAGKVGWHKGVGNITVTLDVIEKLAEGYCKYPNLLAIELLNEPSGSIPRDIMIEYFRLAYGKVRGYCDDSVAVVISDAFNPLDWKDVLTGNEFKNVWLDTHLYQCFSEEDKRRGIHGNIKKAKYEWAELLREIQATRPVIVGEWSLALDNRSLGGLDDFERDKALQAYGAAQLEAYDQAQGWFYWTYKTEDGGAWSLRESIERGWLRMGY